MTPPCSSHHGLLVTYVPVGDPTFDDGTLLDEYSTFEPDVLEIGLASPQPYLDGPTTAASMSRSLDAGFSVQELVERVCHWRERVNSASQVVWMCYPDQDLSLLDEAVGRGAIDGLLMVDLHMRCDVDEIERLLEPTSYGLCGFLGWNPSDVVARAARRSRGYVMVQSRPGVTGSAGPSAHGSKAPAALDVACPIVSGFGIRSRDDIERAARHGYDGIVVGTACIEALDTSIDQLVHYGQDLRAWVDNAFGKTKST